MSALREARQHLDKAREFLDAARDEVDFERFDAATSNAVTAGINSKDAICLKVTGRTAQADNHNDAVGELKGSGESGATLAPTLQRLLGVKSKSQYQTTGMTRSQAENAVRWAQKLYDAAVEVTNS